MITKRFTIGLFALLALLAAGSCATTGDGTADSSVVRVGVVNFLSSTDIGITTEINFSVTNLTDQELKDLTLTVDLNPSNGVDVPFTTATIDRIAPNGSWTPAEPFLVRGRRPGQTTVFFIVTKDGTLLGRNYTIVEVAPGQILR